MTLAYVAESDLTDLTPADRVAGLSFAARVFRSAERAGYRRVIVWAPSQARAIAAAGVTTRGVAAGIATTPDEWRALVDATPADPAIGEPCLPGPQLVIVLPGVVVSPQLLVEASAADRTPDVGGLVPVPAGPEWPISGVFRASAGTARHIERVRALMRAVLERPTPMPSGPDIALERAPLVARAATKADLPQVEETVRRAMFKPNDTFLARLNRGLSLPLSVWLIAHTRVTANALSLAIVAIGLLAAWLLSLGTYGEGVAGALLSLAASILDGSDGEIARLKHEESAFGCWVETIGDYAYYVALFTGLAVGTVRATHRPAFAWIGAGALGGLIAALVLLVVLRRHATHGNPDALQRTSIARFYADGSRWTWLMARISFVATRATMPYGIVVLALLDALPAVLVLACIGANVYWISLALMWPALMPAAAPTADLKVGAPSGRGLANGAPVPRRSLRWRAAPAASACPGAPGRAAPGRRRRP
jgi:phosphatidylglycerophosphate synthase